ncbi:transposase-like protein [Demequina lutea]|uniref:Transposase-like protein n=1 Tax=Demequina lutea TaxID=431489 RepID=A0A7Y9ZCN7_9MICO|nr:transposase-like protein [Demequina lutea]
MGMTIGTEVGDVGADQLRDRNASFGSTLVPKGARRLGGLEDMIVSLYAGGMTIRDIQHHLAALAVVAVVIPAGLLGGAFAAPVAGPPDAGTLR